MSTPPATNIASSMYHSALRVLVLVFAVALVFESGMLSSATQTITHSAGQQFAAAIQATVDSANYTDEAGIMPAMQTQESEVAAVTSSEALSRGTFLLSIVVFILLLLIVLNYILDHLRTKERKLRTS